MPISKKQRDAARQRQELATARLDFGSQLPPEEFISYLWAEVGRIREQRDELRIEEDYRRASVGVTDRAADVIERAEGALARGNEEAASAHCQWAADLLTLEAFTVVTEYTEDGWRNGGDKGSKAHTGSRIISAAQVRADIDRLKAENNGKRPLQKQLKALWGVSRETVRKYIENEPEWAEKSGLAPGNDRHEP